MICYERVMNFLWEIMTRLWLNLWFVMKNNYDGVMMELWLNMKVMQSYAFWSKVLCKVMQGYEKLWNVSRSSTTAHLWFFYENVMTAYEMLWSSYEKVWKLCRTAYQMFAVKADFQTYPQTICVSISNIVRHIYTEELCKFASLCWFLLARSLCCMMLTLDLPGAQQKQDCG